MTIMGFNYNDALSAFLILFAVIDILGEHTHNSKSSQEIRACTKRKATVVAGVIMIVFLFLGESILNLLGVDVQSFAIAGSFVIFFLALEMILGITLYKEESASTASVVPIAFPIRGAVAITLASLITGRIRYNKYHHCYCAEYDCGLCRLKKYRATRTHIGTQRFKCATQSFRYYLASDCGKVIFHQPYTSFTTGLRF